MQAAVWDTYVTKKDGSIMHFDILAPAEIKDSSVIYNYGLEYLKEKGQDKQPLAASECNFCHVETVQLQWAEAIEQKGYFILEMENCD